MSSEDDGLLIFDADNVSQSQIDTNVNHLSNSDSNINLKYNFKTKKEAKRSLSKDNYKKWKKQHKKESKMHKKESKMHKKESKMHKKESKMHKEKRKNKKTSKKTEPPLPMQKETLDIENIMNELKDVLPMDNTINHSSNVPAKLKVTKASKYVQNKKFVIELIEALKEAQKSENEFRKYLKTQQVIDKSVIKPPISRLLLREKLIHSCQCVALQPFLLENGFLNLICDWIWDEELNMPAPLDLRQTALSALLLFEMEGVMSAYKKKRRFDQMKKEYRRKQDTLFESIDEVDQYNGITHEQLINSNLGKCIKNILFYPGEISANKQKATILLERMSRIFSYTLDKDEDEWEDSKVSVELSDNVRISIPKTNKIKWASMHDKTIASPFEMIKTETEEFQSVCNQIDEENPNSYEKRPPLRFKKHTEFLNF